MTMALLSLLLGCFDAPAPAPGPPVAVVVEWSSAPGVYEGCRLYNSDDLYLATEANPDPVQRRLSLARVKRGVECCTHNGGEHVGWRELPEKNDDLYPVCLYR